MNEGYSNAIIPAKEFDRYGSQRDDYANGRELMITVTLAEYRELVEFKAKHENENSKLRLEGYEKDRKIDALQKKIDAYKELFNKQEE